MKKKWITKAEISKILNTYSIQKDEFQPVGDNEYFYQSQFIKGYTISISQETIEAQNYFSETGRIIISHTQYNGKKTYVDIWQRDPDGVLQFRYRNLWNQPLSDVDYIKELEAKNEQLLQSGRKLQEQLAESQSIQNTCKQDESHDLINDTNAEAEIIGLRKQVADLEVECQKLKNDTPAHNARGAGRKPSKERLDAIEQVKTLLESGCNDQDIMHRLRISRATFYRYKKNIRN